jgi:PAS domain-containing protein
MPTTNRDAADTGDVDHDLRQAEAPSRTRALRGAILDCANFSSIATDASGVIQIFNLGAERMLGCTAAAVTNKMSPADISDPQEVIARARALSIELGAVGNDELTARTRDGVETAVSSPGSGAVDEATT